MYAVNKFIKWQVANIYLLCMLIWVKVCETNFQGVFSDHLVFYLIQVANSDEISSQLREMESQLEEERRKGQGR